MHKKIRILAVLLAVGSAAAFTIADYVTPDSSTPPAGPVAVGDTSGSSSDTMSADKQSEAERTQAALSRRPAPLQTAAAQPEPTSPYTDRRESDYIVADGQHYPIRTYKALATPNDPVGNQWWTTNSGLPGAWDYGNGTGRVIAVIDTGFALKHQELAGRWLERAGEVGVATTEGPSDLNCTDLGIALSANCNNIDDNQDGINDNETGATTVESVSILNCTAQGISPINKTCNRIDDDGNGYVDDYRGWDFAYGDAQPQAGDEDPLGGGTNHATAVAGTAAGSGNNGVGIAGVSWGAKILPLQALEDSGVGNTLSIARAIRYAADQNADVINLSLGSEMEDSYMRSAIKYALEKGSIVVAASGNDGCDCINWPARYPEVVAVGASNSSGNVTSFTSYGDSLDIVAPGSGMYLPIWTAGNPTAAYSGGMAGTSFASPYISGLLANARARQPNATWGQIVNAMLQSADHRTLTATAPHSNNIGFGFVRADSLMGRVSNALSQNYRYTFTTETTNTLGANSVSQCEAGQIPTAKFYEIQQNGAFQYTISELTAYLKSQQGATVTHKAYMCVGLPTDQIDSPRLIDSAHELANSFAKPL